jgi:hypothetical protein
LVRVRTRFFSGDGGTKTRARPAGSEQGRVLGLSAPEHVITCARDLTRVLVRGAVEILRSDINTVFGVKGRQW